MLSGNDSAMTLAEIQRAIEELPEDEQMVLAAWMAERGLSQDGIGMESLRELRGTGGIRPDYDYKSLRSGKARA